MKKKLTFKKHNFKNIRMMMGEYRHITNIQPRFNDYDLLGHVNNVVYQHYFDLARLYYFQEVIGQRINGNEYTLIMASISTEYVRPILIDEKISVKTRIDLLGNKSMEMSQEIINSETHEIKSTSRASHVVFSIRFHKTTEIPEEWRRKIIAFEEKVGLKYPVAK